MINMVESKALNPNQIDILDLGIESLCLHLSCKGQLMARYGCPGVTVNGSLPMCYAGSESGKERRNLLAQRIQQLGQNKRLSEEELGQTLESINSLPIVTREEYKDRVLPMLAGVLKKNT